jgi:hypothetical protein
MTRVFAELPYATLAAFSRLTLVSNAPIFSRVCFDAEIRYNQGEPK